MRLMTKTADLGHPAMQIPNEANALHYIFTRHIVEKL